MKKLLLFAMAFATLAFVGCKDDKDKNNGENLSFTEPYIGWGASQDFIKNRFGTPYNVQVISPEATMFIYNMSGNKPITAYVFAGTELGASAVFLDTNASSIENFLSNNYTRYSGDLKNYWGDHSNPLSAKTFISRSYDDELGAHMIMYLGAAYVDDFSSIFGLTRSLDIEYANVIAKIKEAAQALK